MNGIDGRDLRWNDHRTARRDELIRAARKTIHRRGPDASMEDIANSAGTSKSVVYRYFGDKAGLQRSVGEDVLERLEKTLHEAALTANSALDGVHRMVHAYLQMASGSPNVYSFVTASPGNSAHIHHFFLAMAEMMREPMQRSLAELGRSEVLPAHLKYWPIAALGMVRSAGEAWIDAPDTPDKPSLDDFADLLTKWVLDGVTLTFPISPELPITETTKPQS